MRIIDKLKSTQINSRHKWTKEEKEYLAAITPGRTRKEILELMNEKFDYQFTLSQVIGMIKNNKLNNGLTGRFQRGHNPWNKGTKGLTKASITSFKKGNIPHNYKSIGSERVNIYGYTEVKTAEPNIWEFKHRLIWEEHYGKIPRGSVILFLDGNKSNLNIDNLILITKEQLLRMNQHSLIKKDADLTKTGINIANLIIKLDEINKK